MKTEKLHSYAVTVSCRVSGAIGIFEDREFYVMSKNASQAHNDAFDKAHKAGYEVYAVRRVSLAD